MPSGSRAFKLALFSLNLLLLNLPASSAHSWLDCSNMLPTGCAGYPLGYPSRNDVDINTKYTYLVKDRRPDAALCQPGHQDIPGNNPFPPAMVTPGQNLHLTWQPDGHLDEAHPSNVEIHWTGVPGTQLYTRSELSPSTLLNTMVFATSGNCDQAWEPNTWCHGHLTIPAWTQPGIYQMIWWWKYDRNPSGEEYSTCFEIVVSDNGIQLREVPVQAQTQVEVPEQIDAATESTAPQTFELAYMMADPVSITDTAVTADNAGSKSNTLGDLITKPDKLLADIPNYSIGENSRMNYVLDNDYLEDETGYLAGDAFNNEENVETSSVLMATPSQVIGSALTQQLSSTNAGTTDNTSTKSDDVKTSVGNKSVQNGTLNTNSLSSNSTSNSTRSFLKPESTTGNDKVRNQTLVRKMPTFDNSASLITARASLPLSGTALLSSTLIALAYMTV
ncbi:hypothetical protein BGZ79_003870 [Entomortierella chlamydospora]|nr:hypothetical protein BGZ79_003870 [Entomortierella chlamydospora]